MASETLSRARILTMGFVEAFAVPRDRAPTYRPVSEIARRIEPSRSGRPVHPSTVVRWITKGVRLQSGVILKLKAKRFPGHWAVSEEDFNDFVEILTTDRCGEPARSRTPDPRVEAALD